METFERYAGYFPEEAVTMMDRHVSRPFPLLNPAEVPIPGLAGIGWADAILPEVVEERPGDDRSTLARCRGAITDAARRLRATLPRS